MSIRSFVQVVIVVAVPVGLWAFPGSSDWLATKSSPAKLWLVAWPLLLGAGLAVIAEALRACRPRWRRSASAARSEGGIARRLVPSFAAARARTIRLLRETERELREWPVAGAMLVGIVSVLFVLGIMQR